MISRRPMSLSDNYDVFIKFSHVDINIFPS